MRVKILMGGILTLLRGSCSVAFNQASSPDYRQTLGMATGTGLAALALGAWIGFQVQGPRRSRVLSACGLWSIWVLLNLFGWIGEVVEVARQGGS